MALAPVPQPQPRSGKLPIGCKRRTRRELIPRFRHGSGYGIHHNNTPGQRQGAQCRVQGSVFGGQKRSRLELHS